MINTREALEALVAKILADPAVSAIIGDRAYNHVPQGTPYPYLGVQFAQMEFAPPKSKNGPPSYQVGIRIDGSSNYFGDAENLALHDALVALLHNPAAPIVTASASYDVMLFQNVQLARGQDGVTHLASWIFSTYLTPT